jgi:hypothetical protein
MKNVMLGFNAGDTFIHCFRGANGFLFAYGLVKAIDDAGRYHSDYQTSSPLRPGNVGPDDHLVTKISESAYLLAKHRGWPNETTGVNQIIAFSNGDNSVLHDAEQAIVSPRHQQH